MNVKNEKGFSLIELLIVVLIVGVLAAIASIGYVAVIRGERNNLQVARLMQYVDMQAKLKSSWSKRRYGTMSELCQQAIMTDGVAKFDSRCSAQTALNNWQIVDANEDKSANYLRDHFGAMLKMEVRKANDTTPNLCVFDDGILRRASSDDPDNCSRSSEILNP